VEAARDRFLVFLRQRHQLQQALDNFRTPKLVNDSKYVTLAYVDQLVLATIYLLRGEGSALGIAEKVNGARVLADIRTGAKMLMEALSDFA
jgi:hypothetical protein